MTHRVRAGLTLVVLAAVAGVVTTAAWGQTQLDLRIREIVLDEDGATRLVLSIDGGSLDRQLTPEDLTITENGDEVGELEVTPLLDVEPQAVAVALLVDTSGSTQGEPLENAKAGAATFARDLTSRDVPVTLISFNDVPAILTPLTTDADAILGQLAGLEAGGETAMYDAIVAAGDQLEELDALKTIVVFSDGGDTASSATILDAASAAGDASARITAVSLETTESDPDALTSLADGTGGRVVSVAEAGELAAAFGQVAQEIASTYVVTYTGQTASTELDVAVTVGFDGVTASDNVVALNPRVVEEPPPPPRPAEIDEPLLFEPSTARTAVFVGAFGAILIVLLILATAPTESTAAKVLRRGLKVYTRSEKGKTKETHAFGDTAIARQATRVADAIPKPKGAEEKLQLSLDRAGWPMRASEFAVIRFGAGVGGGLAAYGIFGNWFLAVVLLVVGWFAPRVILDAKVQRRLAAFEEQMPDTLQLLAGALKAGYGLVQAINTAAQETAEPTASEFGRVITESRLGVPIEDALNDMADRVGSEDFKWVVVAINIQRQIGGNLAQLLETVASTLREREQVRRQINVLAAEGKLSAIILVALPILMALYMIVVNPDYMRPLWTETVGRIMIVGGILLMGIGGLWMRRIIDIDV